MYWGRCWWNRSSRCRRRISFWGLTRWLCVAKLPHGHELGGGESPGDTHFDGTVGDLPAGAGAGDDVYRTDRNCGGGDRRIAGNRGGQEFRGLLDERGGDRDCRGLPAGEETGAEGIGTILVAANTARDAGDVARIV